MKFMRGFIVKNIRLANIQRLPRAGAPGAARCLLLIASTWAASGCRTGRDFVASYRDTGQYTPSTPGLSKGLELDPVKLAVKPAARAVVAAIQVLSGHRSSASGRILLQPPALQIPQWERELSEDPTWIDAYLYLASAHFNLEQLSEALDVLERGMDRPEFPDFDPKTDPKRKARFAAPGDFFELRASIQGRRGERAAALKDYATALGLAQDLLGRAPPELDSMFRQRLFVLRAKRAQLLLTGGDPETALAELAGITGIYSSPLMTRAPYEFEMKNLLLMHQSRALILASRDRCGEAAEEGAKAIKTLRPKKEHIKEALAIARLNPATKEQLIAAESMYPDRDAPEPEFFLQFARYQSPLFLDLQDRDPVRRAALEACLTRTQSRQQP